MHSFVDKRNGRVADSKETGGGRQNHDDLRVSLPIGRPAQSVNPSGINVSTSKRPVNVKMEPGDDLDHASGRRLSGGRRAFYDTDASSIGQTSTAASLNGEAANAADDQGDDYSSDVNGDEDAEANEDERVEVDSHQQLHEAERRARARALERQLQAGGMPGAGLPFIKGDSYPTTTSGNPSVSEIPDGGAARSVETQRGFQATAPNLANRQSNQRRLLASVQGSTQQAQAPAYPSHTTPNQVQSAFAGRPNGSKQDPVAQINSGFAFSTPPQQQQRGVAPPTKPQQKAVGRTSAPITSTNTAQLSMGPTNGGRSHDSFSEQQRAEKQRDRQEFHNVYSTAQDCQLQQNVAGNKDQRVRFEQMAEHGQNEETDLVHDDDRNTHQAGQQLDYAVDQLYEMDYHELKKEPFDVNPNAQEVENGQQNEAITDRMTAVQKIQTQAQAQFFRGLSIKEWEEGGDWFLDQFSIALNQLKDVRQQRRKAAQEYENEIEGRFKAVGQKRKQIDEALSEMKESGGKVLQGTPKKAKTK